MQLLHTWQSQRITASLSGNKLRIKLASIVPDPDIVPYARIQHHCQRRYYSDPLHATRCSMLKVNFHKLPCETILSARCLKTKENYFFLVNQTKLYKSKLLSFHPLLNTYSLHWYNPHCRQNTNNFLQSSKLGNRIIQCGRRGISSLSVILCLRPFIFSWQYIDLLLKLSSVMQGNHVMFRHILHMYIGKMRIKNESSNAFKTTFIFKIKLKRL